MQYVPLDRGTRMARTNSELRDAVIEALDEAMREAQRQMLRMPTPLDADLQQPEDLPAEERRRLLTTLGVTDLFLADHIGTPPIAADIATHRQVRAIFSKRILEAYVVGEEASIEDWDRAAGAPLGALILVLDAIDGSGPFEDLTFGYGCTALLYRREAERDTLVCAGVINSSGYLMIYDRDASQVLVGTRDDLRPILAPLHDEFHHESVALLGAKARHRELVRGVLDQQGLTVYTLGGSPAALGLAVGSLGAIVAPEAQTTWDAAFLPILSFLGLTILVPVEREPGKRREAVAIEAPQVIRYFATIERARRDDERPVPEFVVARDALLAYELFEAVLASPRTSGASPGSSA